MSNTNTTDSTTTPAPVVITVPTAVHVPVNINRNTVATITVDLSAMPAAALAFLFDYGLRQNLNDAKAGESDGGNAEALMRKRLARLMAGEFGQRAGGGGYTPTDPVDRIAVTLARKPIADLMRNNGIKKPAEHPDYDRLVAEYAAMPVIREEAERRAAMDARLALNGPAGGGLTLAGLGLATPAPADGPAPDATPAPDGTGPDATPDAAPDSTPAE